jgi:hypothetical protein
LRAARNPTWKKSICGSSSGRHSKAPFNGLERAILSLDQHPKWCPVAPESVDPDHPVRALTYGRKPHAYRILFTVDDDAEPVRVLHVRRGARRLPVPDALKTA